MERENNNSKEDSLPAYFDKYYADKSAVSSDSNEQNVVLNQESDNGSQGSIFNTEIEQQYERLVKEYPDQARIYFDCAREIHEKNPQEMSGLALDGLKTLMTNGRSNNRQINTKVL